MGRKQIFSLAARSPKAVISVLTVLQGGYYLHHLLYAFLFYRTHNFKICQLYNILMALIILMLCEQQALVSFRYY